MSSLTADVLNDLQRNNNPSVFGFDGHGNQTGSNQATYSQAFATGQGQGQGQSLQYNPQVPIGGMPMAGMGGMQGGMGGGMQGGMGGMGGGMQGGMQGGMGGMQGGMGGEMQGGMQGGSQQKSQVNPALVQEFINIVKNVPALSQQFSNQEAFNNVINNPGQMMEIVAKYQQAMSNQPPVEQTQPQQPIQLPQPMPVQSTVNDQSGGDSAENGDMNINEIEPLDKKPAWYDLLFNIIKFPLLLTVIFAILSCEKVKNIIFDFVPKLKKYGLIVLSLLFFTLSVAGGELLKLF